MQATVVVGGRYVGPAIPIEDLLLVRHPLNPELRDAAVADFPIGVVGVLREDQGVEAVPAERSADPGAAAGSPPRGLRDLQVVAYVEVVVVRCVHRSFLCVGVRSRRDDRFACDTVTSCFARHLAIIWKHSLRIIQPMMQNSYGLCADVEAQGIFIGTSRACCRAPFPASRLLYELGGESG